MTDHVGVPVGASPDDQPGTLSGQHDRGGARTWQELVDLVRSDLHRYDGVTDSKHFVKHAVFTPGFKYSMTMRLAGYLRLQPVLKALYPLAKALLLRYRYKYGIAIPEYTVIGRGLFINRFGGIMVNGDTVIGANCNLTHGVMLGQSNRGEQAGSPVVGDRVFLAAGAKVIGHVTLGNDSVVGVNAVVTKDIPERGVAVGIPAKVISTKGSEGYINRQA